MENLKTATFANGCFWCADTVFRQLKGIASVKSGYTGGAIENPDYRQVIQGHTGHAEAIQITYNPAIINYGELLLVFFTTHDPTSLNRQGYDVGTQYRSEIFYHTQEQKIMAEKVIEELNQSTFDHKIVTKLSEAVPFYEAENFHQDFYNLHNEVPYCQIIIDPKLEKLRQYFADKLISA